MKNLVRIFVFAFICVTLFASVAGAVTPYATYTYSINGEVLKSPDAYVPDAIIDSAFMGMEEGRDLTDVRDICVDDKQNIYIVEAGLNRIVALDRYYKLRFEIDEFVNENGIPDKFNGPQGVFVSPEYIYVCDSNNSRVVLFDLNGEYVKTVLAPKSELFDEGDVFTPIAVVADNYGRMFVVSSTTNQGIIVMDDNGAFYGFIGAQKVTYNAIDLFWKKYLQRDKEATLSYVPTEYNNITIDDKNFIYATISSIDEGSLRSAIESKSKSGDYAPVKKLNSTGSDVMRRNGFYPPSGEVKFGEDGKPSKIIDVALGPNRTWSIVDESRSKVFTYDRDGNLLFAFGDTGAQSGNINSPEGIVYQGDKLIVLDKGNVNFTVYRRTEYGDILMQALINQNNRLYDKARSDWEDIIKRNNNFDLAYIGIGQALFRVNNYSEAQRYFKAAHDVSSYSSAYVEVRKEWANKYFWTIPLIAIAVIIVIVKFLKWTGKVNDKATLKVGHKTFVEELCYASHLVLHPFDGFWDLKHEKRGSVRAAFIFLALTIAAFFYKAFGTGYIFSPNTDYTTTIFSSILSVLVPFALFVVANWCLTTLLEGEGSFKDVFIAAGYSLAPLPFLVILSTVASNFLAESETAIMTMLTTIGFIWVGILLFFGIMITHGYSFWKNVLTIILTIVGMAFIMFLAILFSSLMTKIIGFIYSIYEELSYRI